MIASLNGAREKAKTAAIKSEARQLFNLAMEHYAEMGDFTTFASYGWVKGDGQEGATAGACSNRIRATALNRDRAIEICNSINSKLSTNTSGGSAANRMLVSCQTARCSLVHQFSVQVKLNDNAYASGVEAGNWFCIGTSGAVYEGLYSTGSAGCIGNP